MSALEDGWIRSNPAKAPTVKSPSRKQVRAGKKEIRVWTAAQLRAFLEWDRDVYDDDFYTMWATIAGTGLRRSEVLALQGRTSPAVGCRCVVRSIRRLGTRPNRAIPASSTLTTDSRPHLPPEDLYGPKSALIMPGVRHWCSGTSTAVHDHPMRFLVGGAQGLLERRRTSTFPPLRCTRLGTLTRLFSCRLGCILESFRSDLGTQRLTSQ